MIRDDDVEARLPSRGNLADGRDPTVDGEQKLAPLVREPRERFGRDSVAFREAAGQVPADVRAEILKNRDRERGGADAVDVVVPVDADPSTGGDRGPNSLACGSHVSEQERVVGRRLGGEKSPRRLGVAVAPPDEDACCRLGEAELTCERGDLRAGTRRKPPRALVHVPKARTRIGRYPQSRCLRPRTTYPARTSWSSSSVTASASTRSISSSGSTPRR